MNKSSSLFGLLKETIELDISDINYIYSNPKTLERYFVADPAGLPRKGILVRISAFFWHLLKSVNPLEWLKQSKIKSESILFFSISKNQRDSLVPILEYSDSAYLIGKHADYPISFTTFLAHLISLAFFPLVLNKFWQSEGYVKEGFYYIFNKYWLTYGYYASMRLWLRRLRPKALVVSNDHNMEQRAIVKAARDEGVNTIYVQHASVIDELPPLSFDYALLEGYDSLRTYDQIGDSQTKIFLIGMPKFDKYYQEINANSVAVSIGICTNLLEPMGRADQLCKALHKKLPDRRIILRPHPQDKRVAMWTDLAVKYNMDFSDSSTEDAFDFLHQVDVILAGNSSIHLEAALLNVYPIYYDFMLDPRFAKYSFLKTGLCQYVSDPETACEQIEALSRYKPQIRNRTNIYCATVETQYDGRSSELGSKIIEEISAQNEINLKGWGRIPELQLEAYELSGNIDEIQK